MISISTSGSFQKTEKFFDFIKRHAHMSALDSYGEKGVTALAGATPVETGLTARSWTYRITVDNGRPTIEWYNKNQINDVSVAILIQYGHGTGTGGYVHGRDYINPAIQPIFDKIAADVWEKVKNG